MPIGGISKDRYVILVASEPELLAEKVNLSIDDGYTPAGGVSVAMAVSSRQDMRKGGTTEDWSVTYVQAMVNHN